MKKLFTIGSSIVIHASSMVSVTGPYKLLTLHEREAVIATNHYVIEVSGEALIVEKLAEEIAEISFEEIERIHITKATHKEMADGTEKI